MGSFDARYLAFLETIANLRPKLHRYCARMTGSAFDGEDVVQEALFNAYRGLESLEEGRPLAPWLFQIAHNRCIDFIRSRQSRVKSESAAAKPDIELPRESSNRQLTEAIEHLVLLLPPKERGCVLLKDVLDYSLEEIAEMVGSTVGGVKAALHRARTKLESTPAVAVIKVRHDPEIEPILRLYVERFNRQDWDGVRELITADAQLLVGDRFAGALADAPYFSRYSAMKIHWRFAVVSADGELALTGMRLIEGQWSVYSLVRVEVRGGKVARVADYGHCPWVLDSSHVSSDLRQP